MKLVKFPIGIQCALRSAVAALVVLTLFASVSAQEVAQPACLHTVVADVIALDQVFFWNRLGAMQPQGMMFALSYDVFPDGADESSIFNSCAYAKCTEGLVHLRADKRPRPLVLRMNVKDCLRIDFRNLLNPMREDPEQVATRDASVHVIGMQLVNSILDDGSNVGKVNQTPSPTALALGSLVRPGGKASYTLYAEREGQHVLYSAGATTTGEGDGGQLNAGLFGAVNVEPRGAVWLRSQVTAADIDLALDIGNPNEDPHNPGHTEHGHPIIDYGRTYPNSHPRAGLPIFQMLQGTQIVHSDLTAVISGPFTDIYPANPVYPDRDQSFREFTIIYHDEIGALQAFPELFDKEQNPVMAFTLHSVRDGFAINYGTGGIGSEIIANRLNVGPMRNCLGCKYEEFFLSSWTVGDPAMVVDTPANACVGDPTCRATEAKYPDDPSNVYHSYLRDHVKFRILHGGSKEHHIHHQHTHQWLYAPDSDESAYLDSQAIGPGASFTLEMTYNGSGNRNAAVGDSIFHCHFYPHFAQGMWSLWRVHDVFEDGTRRLPDGEIIEGTPIPGVVPIPAIPMAPMPGANVTIAFDNRLPERGGQVQINGKFVRDMTAADLVGLGNPGYPFFVPGVGGSRSPHPPLDTVDDGGLPRHVLLEGRARHVETRLDFTKEVDEADAFQLDENGVPVELAAMKFHETRFHKTFKPDGTGSEFIANGLPRAPGAPYAEPCMVEGPGKVAIPKMDHPRTYKAAVIQLDTIFNKSGWHFPQQRIITLWGDVFDTYDGLRPPEPLFFRARSGDCITYYHTNLVPNIYELDDFQVRTPTDVLGQHIHLVKFDVTSSDGSGNGWNYEDGTFSPDEVVERINAIRVHNGCVGDAIIGGDIRDGTFKCPIAEPHPFFGSGPNNRFRGAQTTVQRWYADDVLDNDGVDRTLRTVFTHDHFGPSTHQQSGLYAGLVVEPADSDWRNPVTGEFFGDRIAVGPTGLETPDGGPTSWRADILTGPHYQDSYREFMLEFQDFALAYQEGSHANLEEGRGPTFQNEWAGPPFGQQPGLGGGFGQPGKGLDSRPFSINPPARDEIGLPDLLEKARLCPGNKKPPCPEAISADEPGSMVVNYRNEPVAMRVRDPLTNGQAALDAGDLALAFSSRVDRADNDYDVQPVFYPPLTPNVDPRDPFTPLMQAREHDRVQIRTLVGAHEEGHNFSVNGIKWFFEPSWTDSGYRNSQMMGISEHFEMIVPQLVKNSLLDKMDYLWASGSSTDDLWNGLWGLMRVFRPASGELLPLPNNPNGRKEVAAGEMGRFDGPCPKDAHVTTFKVVAGTAQQLLPEGKLIYNSRLGQPTAQVGPLEDPNAILYVLDGDLDVNGKLKANVPREPLVLRANAGDCIVAYLENRLPDHMPDQDGYNTLPMIVDYFNNNDIRPSNRAGLHPQLLFYDVSRSDGNDVGANLFQTAAPGQTVKYQWYAGDLFVQDNGIVQVTPIEFGATNLIPADRIKQPGKGAIGALIIEPPGAGWREDDKLFGCSQLDNRPRCSRASATVFLPSGKNFREFTLLFQDDLNLRCHGCGDPNAPGIVDINAVPNLAESEDPEDSGQKALNYRTEPMWFRHPFKPFLKLDQTRELVISRILTNEQVGGDPETPVFSARQGDAVRFRVLEPGGHSRNHIFQVHGHIWQQEPYVNNSTALGSNPFSLWEGARMGHGPTNHFDALLQNGAGGKFRIKGDYLYRDHSSFQFDGGLWGIFRVRGAFELSLEP